MKNRFVLTSLTAAVVLAGCKPGDDQAGAPIISNVAAAALSAAFVTDWAPFEAAANSLRTTDSRYTVQRFTWTDTNTGANYTSNSLANGRVEYAHAAGLTGAGQTISIVDAGFLTTHVEFTGKTISTPPGYVDTIDDHGTSVASIAAGVANAGQMIGVAPAANLQLGLFNTFSTMTAANQQALSLGAIVQNNSWGYDTLNVSQGAYNSQFGSGAGKTYMDSLRTLAQNTVIVFAADNNPTRTVSDLMAGLPSVVPSLQNSWITVVDAVPVFSGSTITSATVVSSKCLTAAAWCMAADGSIYGALSTGNNSYGYGGGTSFAAPQISGAIALLAEAFPTLTATELRARLLASADNNFFAHDNYVQFAPGVKHGFSSTYGHGFLNLKAALSPIGGSYLARSTGRSVSLDSPILVGGGISGNSLSARLASYDLVVTDGLGTGFDMPASVLTAQAISAYDPLATLQDLFATDLKSPDTDPFNTPPSFSRFANGQELDFGEGDTRLALLVPASGATDASYGFSLSRNIAGNGGLFRLGFSAMREGDGFVGLRSLLPGESLSGTHAAATMEWGIPLSQREAINISGSFGIAVADAAFTDLTLSPVTYNALSVSYGANDVFSAGDRFAFAVSLPQAVQSGSARITMPVARSNGSTAFSTIDIPLTPEGRQIDLTMSYGFEISDQSDVILSAAHRFNDANISGNNNTEAAIALRIRF